MSTATLKVRQCQLLRVANKKKHTGKAHHRYSNHMSSALLIDHTTRQSSGVPYSPYTSGVGHLMQLLPRQSLARLQHFLTVNRRLATPHHCCAASRQPSVQQLCPAAASVTGSAAPLCVTGAQLCTQHFSSHLQPPADVSRFHTTRHVAARSTANASGETDSVAAVKRLVSCIVACHKGYYSVTNHRAGL